MPRGIGPRHSRAFEECRRDLEQIASAKNLFGEPDQDLSRGAIRLVGEALIAAQIGIDLPPEIMERALTIAQEITRG